MSKFFRKAGTVVGVLAILCGVAGFLYPPIGRMINNSQRKQVIVNYQKDVEKLEDHESDALMQEAIEYNEWVRARGRAISSLTDEETERYNSVLDMSVTTVMGYITIPKINVVLPIYHGTGEDVLQAGVGHLAGSSLPIGGESSHCVLTGHSGLPSNKLFTDLDKLTYGDYFTVSVLGQDADYVIEKIETILPEDADEQFEDGKDLCTLVTCTPIGVNTHRLMVTGKRVFGLDKEQPPQEVSSQPPQEVTEQQKKGDTLMTVCLLVIILNVVIAVAIIVFGGKKRRKKEELF